MDKVHQSIIHCLIPYDIFFNKKQKINFNIVFFKNIFSLLLDGIRNRRPRGEATVSWYQRAEGHFNCRLPIGWLLCLYD